MSNSLRVFRRLWPIVPIAALGYFLFLGAARLQRVDQVTHLVETEATVDASSATGYNGGLRNLVVPEHNNESYQWILQTQQMLAPTGHWRIREEHYDNAPVGRTILTPSLYRGWLGIVATVDRAISGLPSGLSVERAARIADPILFILLLVITVPLARRHFGVWPAILFSVALVTLFPLGGAFVPAQPSDGALLLVFAVTSFLLLLVGVNTVRTTRTAEASPTLLANEKTTSSEQSAGYVARWFFASGVALGLVLWIDAVRAVPFIIGLALGGFAQIWKTRNAIKSNLSALVLPWRYWALGGALTTLSAYLLEYYPGHLGAVNLQEVHPLYGIAWLGLAELLAQTGTAVKRSSFFWRDWRSLISLVFGVLAIAAVPVALVATEQRDLFSTNPAATCLTNLAGSPVALNLWTWLVHDGITFTFVATCGPLILIGAALVLLFFGRTDPVSQALLAIAIVPALVVAGFACFQLRSWNDFDAVTLALVLAVAFTACRIAGSYLMQGAYLSLTLLVLSPGALLLRGKAIADRQTPVSDMEVQSLIERDLGHWLARQAGSNGAVVLAPPSLTMSLIYYGGLSGLVTPFLENKAGFVAATRIAGASTADEAQAIVNGRNVGYIVMPAWDGFFDDYARSGSSDAQQTLAALLQHWLPPRWLRPVPYHVPKVPGFEEQTVVIFRVVEVQDNATALSCLAEYFVEMGMLNEAARVADALENAYPADLGAAAARAIVSHAREDTEAFTRAFNDTNDALSRGDDEILAWDRRVSLAIALVDGRRLDQAKVQVKRCLAEIDESHLRSLTTVSLHRLLVMCRGFGLKIENPSLNSLAQQLLPAELREHP
jgi:hypothetical protein